MSERPDTPQRLVRACAYLGVIGTILLVHVLVVLLTWYSDSSQDRVKWFTDPMVREGLDRGDAEAIYRGSLALIAVVAASVLVFAIYTAMGHSASRVMLTIVVPVMALLGFTLDSFVLVVVSWIAVFFLFQLWHSEVNAWFARLSGKTPPAPPAASAWPPPAPAVQPPPPGPTQQSEHQVPPQQWAPHPQAYAPPRPQPPADVVKVLSILTVIIASVVAAGCGFYLLIYELAREDLVKEMLRSESNWMDLSEPEIRANIHDLAVISWVLLPVCLVAVVVASVLLVRRRRRN